MTDITYAIGALLLGGGLVYYLHKVLQSKKYTAYDYEQELVRFYEYMYEFNASDEAIQDVLKSTSSYRKLKRINRRMARAINKKLTK